MLASHTKEGDDVGLGPRSRYPFDPLWPLSLGPCRSKGPARRFFLTILQRGDKTILVLAHPFHAQREKCILSSECQNSTFSSSPSLSADVVPLFSSLPARPLSVPQRADAREEMATSSDGGEYFSAVILFLAAGGFVVNVASVCILAAKGRRSMFHNLLKLLALYDLVVVTGCAMLYAIPNLWRAYRLSLYPRMLPWLLPLVQIAMASSVLTTIAMSLERYVRICHLCQMKGGRYINEDNFR